jgi:hypothetical protein
MSGTALAVIVLAGWALGALGPAPTPPSTPPGPAPPGYRPGGPSPSVSITVVGIRATNEPKENIDPSLLPIANELRRSRFNSFQLVVNDTRSVPMTTSWEVMMVEDYALQIQPMRQTDDRVFLVVSWVRYEQVGGKLQARPLQRMSFEIRKGKYLLSGGWRLKQGALMAAIAVK